MRILRQSNSNGEDIIRHGWHHYLGSIEGIRVIGAEDILYINDTLAQ
jgi:hypothetical protein